MMKRTDSGIRPLHLLLMAALAFGFLLTSSSAAAATGVHGRVFALTESSEMEGVVPGARLEFLAQGGGTVGRTTSDEDGYYRANLKPGTYIYRVRAPGFRAEDLGRGLLMEVTEGFAVYNFSLTPGSDTQPETEPQRAPEPERLPLPEQLARPEWPDRFEERPPVERPEEPRRPENEVRLGRLRLTVLEELPRHEPRPALGARIDVRSRGASVAYGQPAGDGGFRTEPIPMGDYRVLVEKEGFNPVDIAVGVPDHEAHFEILLVLAPGPEVRPELLPERPVHPGQLERPVLPEQPERPEPEPARSMVHVQVVQVQRGREMPMPGAEVVVCLGGEPVAARQVDGQGHASFHLRRNLYEIQAHAPGFGMQRQRLDLRGGDARARMVFQQPERPTPDRPIEPPVERPIERPIGRPIEPSLERPIRRPIEPNVKRPGEHPILPPAEQPIRRPIHRPIERPVEHPTKQAIEQPIGQPIEAPVDRLNGQPIDRLVEPEPRPLRVVE
jgi:hypothetical protein